jgi:uncharacterized protein YjcR
MKKQSHAKNRCGAKTRGGNLCKNGAMANGRCRMHGGKAGAPKANRNAVTTGEHEAIWMDALEDDERVFFDVIKTDVLQQLDDDIKLYTLRERRMLKRIQSLNGKDLNVVTYEQRQGVDQGQKSKYDVVKRENAIDQIQRIEDALTRVQDKKAKLLEMKHKIQDGDNSDETADWVTAVQKVAEKRRASNEAL